MGELGLNRNRHFRQGVFVPKNKEKFDGEQAIYRSGLELKYFKKLDENPNVIKWGSENVVVPYFFENKWHKYYIDLYVVFKVGDKIKKFFIEIKPQEQVEQPQIGRFNKQERYLKECATWQKNLTKWKYAKEYAEKNGFEFHVLTERDVKGK